MKRGCKQNNKLKRQDTMIPQKKSCSETYVYYIKINCLYVLQKLNREGLANDNLTFKLNQK